MAKPRKTDRKLIRLRQRVEEEIRRMEDNAADNEMGLTPEIALDALRTMVPSYAVRKHFIDMINDEIASKEPGEGPDSVWLEPKNKNES